MRQKSFTIIELLVVAAVIGLMASIVIVSVTSVREKARIAKIRQFATSVYHSVPGNVGFWDFENGFSDKTGSHDSAPKEISDASIVNDKYMGRVLKTEWGYIRFNENTGLENRDGAITVEGWAKPIDDNGVTIAISSLYDGYNWALEYLGWGEVQWEIRNNPRTVGCRFKPDVSSIFVKDRWNHVAGTYDGISKSKLFVNGQEITWGFNSIGGGCSGRIYAYEPVDIGGGVSNGYIDEVRVYHKVLLGTEIQKHYAEGAKKRGLILSREH